MHPKTLHFGLFVLYSIHVAFNLPAVRAVRLIYDFAGAGRRNGVFIMKTVYLLLCLMLAVILIILPSACGTKPGVAEVSRKSDGAVDNINIDASFDEIKEKGILVIGFNTSIPPLSFKNEQNEIVGFDIDLAKEIGILWGVDVEITPIDSGDITSALNEKKIDLIWNGFTVMPEREEEILFSKPYLENKQIIITVADSEINKKEELAGKLVGIHGDSPSEDSPTNDTEAYSIIGSDNIRNYEEIPTAIADLNSKKIEAFVMDDVVFKYQFGEDEDKYKILDEYFAVEIYAVGGRLTDKALIVELDSALQQLKDDGISGEISQKWFNKVIVK